jgi:hypothetical protein
MHFKSAGAPLNPTRERYSALMAFLREHYLYQGIVDLLRTIRGRYFNLGRQLHSNSWFNHDLREDP